LSPVAAIAENRRSGAASADDEKAPKCLTSGQVHGIDDRKGCVDLAEFGETGVTLMEIGELVLGDDMGIGPAVTFANSIFAHVLANPRWFPAG
jgi:hypothetical protein